MKLVFYPNSSLDRTLPALAPYATIAGPAPDGMHSAVTKDALMQITDDMLAVMQGCRGVGLAANQVVGVDFRIFVMGCPEEAVKVFLNPRLIQGFDEQEMGEACLSFPGVAGKTRRFSEVIVEAITCANDYESGTYAAFQLEGMEAQCFQHELDHLNGVHMGTGAGPVKRDQIRRKVDKAARAAAR